MKHLSFIKIFALGGLVLIPFLGLSQPTYHTWTGSGGDNRFSTSANWLDGAVPGSGGEVFLVFNSAARTTANNDAWDMETFGGLALDSLAPAPFTISGNGLQLNTSISNLSPHALTLSMSSIRAPFSSRFYANAPIQFNPTTIELGNSVTLSLIGNGVANTDPDTITISGRIFTSGWDPPNNHLELLNDARVTLLNANNSYNQTIIKSGSLTIGNGSTSGSIGSGPITLYANQSIQFNLPAPANLSIPNTFTTFNLASGNSWITNLGPGSITLTGSTDNSGLGAVLLNGKIILAKSTDSSIHALNGPVIVHPGATLALSSSANGNDQLGPSASLQLLGGTLDLSGDSSEVLSSLSGTGLITNSQPDSAALIEAFSGDLSGTIQTLAPNSSITLGKAGSGTFNFNGTAHANVRASGGTLGLSGSILGSININQFSKLAVGGPGRTASLAVSSAPVIVTDYDFSGQLILELANNNQSDRLILSGQPYARSGKLIILNIDSPLAGGETFDLFDVPSFSGAFTSVTLPSLGSAKNWHLDELYTTGKIYVNRHPAPTSLTVQRMIGTDLKIPVADILAAANDPDVALGLDTLTLLSVRSLSQNPAQVTISGTHLFYTRPAGSDTADTLEYIVQDARGSGEITGQIQITCVTPTVRITDIRQLDGKPALRVDGIPGYQYAIERCGSPEFPNPELQCTFTASIGTFEWSDPSPLTGEAYYRLRWIP